MHPASPDAPSRVAPPFAHPVSELLTRYLSIASPARAQAAMSDDAPSSFATRSRSAVQRRAEEIWDALGDFA
jgi:hypothetical protein